MGKVIKVENLGKKYIISHQSQEKYTTLRDVIANNTKAIAKKIINPRNQNIIPKREEFWALKNVSFEINKGDRLGIIGKNGAGKTTILKLLSRITEPTEGRISIKGKVASLLEVGTGFHPELTGRENIFLNGAVLGMSKTEIRRKFDEIIEFAGVERFLDTPVKRYSSGMYVRLAFAVAAHLEPEILLIDEVLAVGDVQFQKKCLHKMEDVSKEGRTVLFVSHNMNAVKQVCNSCILLEAGRIKQFDKDVQKVIKNYIFDEGSGVKTSRWVNSGNEFNNQWFKPQKFFIADGNGNKLFMPVENNSDMWIQIEGEVKFLDPLLTIGYAIFTEKGGLVYWSYHTDSSEDGWPKLKKGKCVLRSMIPKRFLNEGTYKVDLMISIHRRKWLCEPGINTTSIYLTIQGGLSDSPHWIEKRPGIIAPLLKWECSQE